MEGPVLSQRARRRLVVAAALGMGGYAAYCTWRDNARLRKAVRSTAAELQRCGEAALTRATACVIAGTVQGVAMVRPQAVEAPAPREPWQAMVLEKLIGLLTTNAGMDLVSLAVAVGAQHSVAAFCEHWAAQRRAAATQQQAALRRGRPTNGHRNGAQHAPSNRQPQGQQGQQGQQHHGAAAQQQGQAHPQPQQHPQRWPTNGADDMDGGPTRQIGHPIVAQLLDWAATPQGERFVVKAMAAAAANSTRAYMDTLGAGNTYDDIFAAAFAPGHREALKELTVMATREAVSTYLCPPQPHRADREAASGRHARRQQDGSSWSSTLHSIGSGTAFLIKQVSHNSRAAAVALPVVVLASSKGLALGCRDAFSRFRADPSDYQPSLSFAQPRALLFDSARNVLWLALCAIAVLVLCASGVKHLLKGEGMAALHM